MYQLGFIKLKKQTAQVELAKARRKKNKKLLAHIPKNTEGQQVSVAPGPQPQSSLDSAFLHEPTLYSGY